MPDEPAQTPRELVFRAVRRYAESIGRHLQAHRLEPDRTEELAAAIRLARTMRCATSLAGSHTLNRLGRYQEEVLESIACPANGPTDEALDVLHVLFQAVETITGSSLESDSLQSPGAEATDCQDELMEAAKAYCRLLRLPEDEHEREITGLLRSASADCMVSGPHDSSIGTPAMECFTDLSQGGQDVIDTGGDSCSEEAGETIPAELIEIFLEEADELTQRIYRGLSHLSEQPHDRETLQEVRRAAHTLKGAAGAVGLKTATRLAHRMEDLLDALYQGTGPLDHQQLDLLARTTDTLLDLVRDGGPSRQAGESLQEIYAAYASYMGEANGAAQVDRGGCDVVHGAAKRPEPVAIAPCDETGLEQYDTGSMGRGRPNIEVPSAAATAPGTRAAGRPTSHLRVAADRLEELGRTLSELVMNRNSLELGVTRLLRSLEEQQPALARLREVGGELDSHRHGSAAGPEIRSESRFQREQLLRAAAGHWPRDGGSASAFDDLEFDRFTGWDLWSQSFTEASSDIKTVWLEMKGLTDELASLLAQQRQLTRQAQETLREMQMVPFDSIMPRLQRTLREVASSREKKVDLLLEGEDVAIDRLVLEEMVQPLQHLIRNSVDHGIETPPRRGELGKSAAGSIRIRLTHVGTQVILRYSDDGKGLDTESIRQAAVRNGQVAGDRMESMTDAELYQLIFVPGFSTATFVSEISGRGVGMDVVASCIGRLGGKIDVDSEKDQGTTFTIRLPVSLAAAQALIVTARGEPFAIPQRAVQSILRFTPQEASCAAAGLSFEGKELPLVHLGDLLGIPAADDLSHDGSWVAVLKAEFEPIALRVDGIQPGREIVVKSLGSHLTKVPGLLGATILGDGTVVPILEPAELKSLVTTEPRALTPPSATMTACPRDLCVMVVDDSVSVRRVMQRLIEHAGWTAVTARDGVDALEMLTRMDSAPDVFLLDVEMPRMDGYQLLSSLRQQEKFAATPIVMITSRSGEKHRQLAMARGATAYLTKPFHEQALIELIQGSHLAT